MPKYNKYKPNQLKYHAGKATLELLQEKCFDNIKILEICNKAHISRSSYYRSFDTSNSKVESISYYIKQSWLIKEKSAELSNIPTNLVLLDFLYMNKDNILNLANNNLIHIIYNFLFEFVDTSSLDTKDFYITHIQSGILIGIVHALIENKFSDSQETVTEQIFTSIINNNLY